MAPNPLFCDGMVIQREKSFHVWGNARDGEKITIEFANQKIETIGTAGTWKASLEAMEAVGPHSMKISGDNVVTINNILIGDVWLC